MKRVAWSIVGTTALVCACTSSSTPPSSAQSQWEAPGSTGERVEELSHEDAVVESSDLNNSQEAPNSSGDDSADAEPSPLSPSTEAPRVRVRIGATQVNGRLLESMVRRVVLQSLEHLRKCYEEGLTQDSRREGRILVRFVINEDGSVSQPHNGGTDIPRGETVTCLVEEFGRLHFPAPERNVVYVSLPLMFESLR